jgi:hypothetical protein
VSPFVSPIGAVYLYDGKREPVAIVAVDDEEYLAVTESGQTVAGPWAEFEVVDPDILAAVARVRYGYGS